MSLTPSQSFTESIVSPSTIILTVYPFKFRLNVTVLFPFASALTFCVSVGDPFLVATTFTLALAKSKSIRKTVAFVLRLFRSTDPEIFVSSATFWAVKVSIIPVAAYAIGLLALAVFSNSMTAFGLIPVHAG